MNYQKFDIGIEDFICRIPALFPYLEWNEDGTVETRPATDSPNGSYDKVVDNMKIPEGVRLVNYVDVQDYDVEPYYSWNAWNTISLSENDMDYFANSSSAYLRKCLWYSYVYQEDEIPDAVEVDMLPKYVSDDSPSYIKIEKIGVDGIPVECNNTVLYDYYKKDGRYKYYKRKVIISPCTTYSYRTIIKTYYKYKDIVGSGNSFVKFVETGIGRIDVNRELLGLTDMDINCEVPEYVYLSQVRSMIDVYDSYRKASEHYQSHYESNGKTSVSLKEKHLKYIRMGGDNMLNWLKQMMQKAYDVANEYKCHADNKQFDTRFSLNLMLTKHTDTIGLETVYVNEFVPGNRYYDGDLITYQGRTYICVLDRYLPGGNNYSYVVKSKRLSDGTIEKGLFVLSGSTYIHIDDSNISYVYGTLPTNGTTYVVFDGNYYHLENNEYVYIEVIDYCTGVIDENTLEYEFDFQHFVPLSEITENEWYDDTNLDGDRFRYFTEVEYLPSTYVSEYVKFGDGVYYWDEENTMYMLTETDEYEYTVSETVNSKLKDLRVFRNYVNPFGVNEQPVDGKDWLFYYKVGNITGKVVETDSLGNIVDDYEEAHADGDVCYNLHAYGNVITSIEYDGALNMLTFKYVIGGHLLAVYDGHEHDIDGNLIRYYRDFSYDDTTRDGVSFSETYKCDGNAVASLGSDFEAYVNGDLVTMMNHAFEKFPFNTVPVMTPDGNYSVLGNGMASIPAENGYIHARTVREEWMNGLYHQPKVKSSVSVDRGNGASFERHIRLGEINTMEDFANYQNGSYFKISES